jgi:hypothetical protein
MEMTPQEDYPEYTHRAAQPAVEAIPTPRAVRTWRRMLALRLDCIFAADKFLSHRFLRLLIRWEEF